MMRSVFYAAAAVLVTAADPNGALVEDKAAEVQTEAQASEDLIKLPKHIPAPLEREVTRYAEGHGIHRLPTHHEINEVYAEAKKHHVRQRDVAPYVAQHLKSRDLKDAILEVKRHFPHMRIPVTYVAILAEKEGFLNPQDTVAISFWIISIAMVASTVFFLMESMTVAYKWKTSMNVGALVTLVAAVHYFYMREFWIQIHASPIVYRYIDWSITVPLQMVEFYLILKAVKPDVSGGMFWRLLVGTIIMLAFGYMGESRILNPVLGFIVGMAGWGFILSEIFVGEAGKVAAGKINSPFVKSSFGTMRFIVTAGWSIYPLGYFFGYLLGAVRDSPLNLVYNLADFVNKIAFCLAIWHSAKADTAEQNEAAKAGYKAMP
jgi:hypothetical protein